MLSSYSMANLGKFQIWVLTLTHLCNCFWLSLYSSMLFSIKSYLFSKIEAIIVVLLTCHSFVIFESLQWNFLKFFLKCKLVVLNDSKNFSIEILLQKWRIFFFNFRYLTSHHHFDRSQQLPIDSYMIPFEPFKS
jgi:hypothetical protein